MSSDQFALWLNNRELFNELTDDTLQMKQHEIIEFFGGFRTMINLCLSHQFTMDLPNHQQLFILLNQFANQQNQQMSTKSIENTQIIKTNTSNLLYVSDINISLIFNHLNTKDHISFQRACKTLTIIGRRKESFNDKHCRFLHTYRFQHKLSYITNCIQSENVNDWEKAICVTKQVIDLDYKKTTMTNVNTICCSGLISSFVALTRKCMLINPKMSGNILSLLYDNLMYCEIKNMFINTFLKCNIFELLKDVIINCNGQLIKQSLLILDVLYEDGSIGYMLNNMNFIDVLVNNIKKFDFHDFQLILEIIGYLMILINQIALLNM
eukprot:139232_1